MVALSPMFVTPCRCVRVCRVRQVTLVTQWYLTNLAGGRHINCKRTTVVCLVSVACGVCGSAASQRFSDVCSALVAVGCSWLQLVVLVELCPVSCVLFRGWTLWCAARCVCHRCVVPKVWWGVLQPRFLGLSCMVVRECSRIPTHVLRRVIVAALPRAIQPADCRPRRLLLSPVVCMLCVLPRACCGSCVRRVLHIVFTVVCGAVHHAQQA